MTQPRAAAPRDLARIAALARWVWLDSYATQGVTSRFAAYVEGAFDVAALAERLAQEPMWLVEDEAADDTSDPALWAWMELDSRSDAERVEVTRLYVAPPCQGRGLGAALLRQARALHPARAIWLSAWEGNDGALKFYRREGASLLGETWFELEGQRHRNEVLGWPPLEIFP